MLPVKFFSLYLLKTVFFLSLALILLASSIIKDSFMASHCGHAAIKEQREHIELFFTFKLTKGFVHYLLLQ